MEETTRSGAAGARGRGVGRGRGAAGDGVRGVARKDSAAVATDLPIGHDGVRDGRRVENASTHVVGGARNGRAASHGTDLPGAATSNGGGADVRDGAALDGGVAAEDRAVADSAEVKRAAASRSVARDGSAADEVIHDSTAADAPVPDENAANSDSALRASAIDGDEPSAKAAPERPEASARRKPRGRWWRGFTGSVAAGLAVLAVGVLVVGVLCLVNGAPGPGMLKLVGHPITAVIALALQRIADRRVGKAAVGAGVGVLVVAGVALSVLWWF